MSLLINQGTLNRLRGSVVYGLFPNLNVTASYLAKEAISVSFDGDFAQLLPSLTGGVSSPEPYVFSTVTIHMLRSQSLANAYKIQNEVSSLVGPVSVIGDSSKLNAFAIENTVIQSFQELTFDGNQPGFVVRLRGVYNVNAALYLGQVSGVIGGITGLL
jgi:hypothetical protein